MNNMQEIDKDKAWAIQIKEQLLNQRNEHELKQRFVKAVNEYFKEKLEAITPNPTYDAYWEILEKLARRRRECLELWK